MVLWIPPQARVIAQQLTRGQSAVATSLYHYFVVVTLLPCIHWKLLMCSYHICYQGQGVRVEGPGSRSKKLGGNPLLQPELKTFILFLLLSDLQRFTIPDTLNADDFDTLIGPLMLFSVKSSPIYQWSLKYGEGGAGSSVLQELRHLELEPSYGQTCSYQTHRIVPLLQPQMLAPVGRAMPTPSAEITALTPP